MKYTKYILTTGLIISVFCFANQAYATAFAASDNFDSYSAGALNGSNGGSGWSAAWTAGAAFSVTTAQAYSGANSINSTNAGQSASRTWTAASSGSIYFAFRTPFDTLAYPQFFSGATEVSDWAIYNGASGNGLYLYSGSYQPVCTGLSANTWYVANIEWDDAAQDNKQRGRCYAGGSWGSFSSWMTVYAAFTTLDKILFYLGANGTIYIDSIQDTDPTAVTPTAPVSFGDFIMFE